jgi:hypothetical protein
MLCRYCQNKLNDDEIPKYYVKKIFIKDESGVKCTCLYVPYKFKRCPKCLKALDFEIEPGIPQEVVWKGDKRDIIKK